VEDVISTAERVQEFCLAHGVDGKTATYSALCLEEMADNVVEHGFTKEKNEKRKHTIELRVIYEEESIMLRIKDDCVPYDPAERAALLQGDDVTHNIGLRMVTKLSKDMTYHNLMGLNVLTIYM
jgi:anti-sigma regulatory factor (Ser/Thr protein kinase)